MSTYQQAAHAPSNRPSIDVAAWALVALIVAAVCAGAGWALASYNAPGSSDVARTVDLAGREGLIAGQRAGYVAGAKSGRSEAALRTRSEVSAARRSASCDGYSQGYAAGRSRAGDRDAYFGSSVGLGSGTCGVATGSYASSLGTASIGGPDVPGYSTSAFDSYGYGGAGASNSYLGSSGANGPGDSTFGY